jgi:hypothetical protein
VTMYEKKIEKAKEAFGKLRGYDEIMMALGKTSDQALLAYVAAHEYSEDFSDQAFKRLTDRDALEYIVYESKNFPNRSRAFRTIGYSQEELLEIYRTSRDKDLQNLALGEIKDQDVLAEIALSEKDDILRGTVLYKLEDRPTLLQLMSVEPDGSNREKIIEKIDDKDCLARAAIEDDDSYVRKKAIERIDDQAVLAEAARKDPEYSNRWAAVERLEDQAALLEIAGNDEYHLVRLEAARRITDSSALKRLLEITEDEEVKKIAMKGTGRGNAVQRDLMKKLRDCLEEGDDLEASSLMMDIESEITDPAIMDEGIDVILKCLKGDAWLRYGAADAMIFLAKERPEVLKKHWNAIAELVNEPETIVSHEDYHIDTTETQKLSCATDEHTDKAEKAGIGKEFPPYPGE